MNSSGIMERDNLFICDGKALHFNIKGCEEKSEVQQVIELFGGVIVNKQNENVIQLVSPTSGIKYDNDGVSVKYIYACVAANKLLSMDNFLVNAENSTTNSESEDDDDEEEIAKDEAVNIGGMFDRAADEAIVNYINRNKLHKHILSNETYKLMETEPLLNKFTSHKMRQRFFDHILPSITEFNVTEQDIRNFLNLDSVDSESSVEKTVNVKVEPQVQEMISAIQPTGFEEAILPDVDLGSNGGSSRTKKESSIDPYCFTKPSDNSSMASKSLIEEMRQNLLCKAGPRKILGQSSGARSKPLALGMPISYYDCVDIINYIYNNNCFQDLKSDHTWKNMAKHESFKRFTQEMLREKFETMLPKILDFASDISSKRLKPFLIYAGKECIIPMDVVKHGLCHVLNECVDKNCKLSHDKTGGSEDFTRIEDGEEFTKIEDLAILNFIVKKNCFNDLKSAEVWQEMAKQSELKWHTVTGLRYRFKTLVNLLKNHKSKMTYYLPEQKSKLFNENYDRIMEDLGKLEEAEKDRESEYTRTEDYAIFGFIMEKHCVKDLESNEVWREMQKHPELKHHTSASLRKRFEDVLLPRVEQFHHCLPRKFLKAFLEYRFSKNNCAVLRDGDRESLVKLFLPDGTPEIEYPSRSVTGKLVPTTRFRQTKTTSTSAPSTSTRSESLKIFNLKKSLGEKLTLKAQSSTSSASIDSFDSQLLKDVVPGIKTMQEKFRRATQEKTSESTNPAISLDSSYDTRRRTSERALKRSSKNSSDSILPRKVSRSNDEGHASVSSRLQRKGSSASSSESVVEVINSPSFLSVLKGKLDKSMSARLPPNEKTANRAVTISDTESIDSSASTSLKQKSNSKTNTKENITESPKRLRGKLTETSDNRSTQSPGNNSIQEGSASTNSHIEMLKKAKKGVFDVEQQISKWCSGSSGNLVYLRVDHLKDVVNNLKNIEVSLYKAVLAARVEMIMKSPLLSITPDDEFQLQKYLQIFKNK